MPTIAKEIQITPEVKIGASHLPFLIGGPCVIENEGHTLLMAERILNICDSLHVPLIFKSSFDKANRSSHKSYRGPGLDKGLQILSRVKEKLGIPVLSDVHEIHQVSRASEVLDVIQIPAFLCRQTDLILEAARTKKPLNLKKGQFLSPHEMRNVVEKALSQGNESLILTERGTSFGYNNLVFDARSIPIMKEWGFPVAVDASHSIQKPGGEGTSSGGESEFIPIVAKAGVSVGADGIFLEIHDNPSKALSDGYNSLNIKNLRALLKTLVSLKKALAKEKS